MTHGLYEKLYVNLLEISFIFNMCILSTMTQYLMASENQTGQVVVTHLCVGVAFLEFLGIMAFHLYLRVKDAAILRSFLKRAIAYLKRVVGKLKAKKGPFPMSKTQKPAIQIPTQTFVDLRESLLED